MSKIVKKYKELLKCALSFDRRSALLLHRDFMAWSLTLDYGCSRRHLLCGHWWVEQLYSVGNAHVGTGFCRCIICDWYGACCRHSIESDDGFTHLGLLFLPFNLLGQICLPFTVLWFSLPCCAFMQMTGCAISCFTRTSHTITGVRYVSRSSKQTKSI